MKLNKYVFMKIIKPNKYTDLNNHPDVMAWPSGHGLGQSSRTWRHHVSDIPNIYTCGYLNSFYKFNF